MKRILLASTLGRMPLGIHLFGKGQEGIRLAVLDAPLRRVMGFVPAMLAGASPAHGRFVAVASTAGTQGLYHLAAYCAAKHAVVGLTKSAAIEYAQDGIRVNCVNPGYIKTPMTRETMDERYDEIIAKVPVRRLGVPEEIAEAVVWMCSDKASFMTGASHVIDGGYSAA